MFCFGPTASGSEATEVSHDYLTTIGSYPAKRHGQAITDLGDGRYFVHGSHRFSKVFGLPQDNEFLKKRLHYPHDVAHSNSINYRTPWLWLPEHNSWKKLDESPQCSGDLYLQAITALADGSALLTGGFCDEGKMVDDPSGYPVYRRTSRLNIQTLTWEASPDLQQQRIYHTASLLSDGTVLVVGGQDDPALSVQLYPVLRSAEKWVDGHFVPAPALNVASASHTATALAGNNLLIAGGFDADGQALNRAELWHNAQHRWEMLPGLNQARYAHQATLLADGRVLVSGGFDSSGQLLSSTELWDPNTRQWQAGAEIPIAAGFHRTARLVNGDVLLIPMVSKTSYKPIPIGYRWHAATDHWQALPEFLANDWQFESFVPTIAPTSDGSANIFGAHFIWHWHPQSTMPKGLPARWDTAPALARLSDDSIMLITLTYDGASWLRRAYTWQLGTDSWQPAGQLPYIGSWKAYAWRLNSGRVIHLLQMGRQGIVCHISQADLADAPWESCGEIQSSTSLVESLELGALTDGRAVAIINSEEAYVFDEENRHWQAAKLEWQTTEFAWGTAVRTATPMTVLHEVNKDTGQTQTHDISQLAANYWSHLFAHRDYQVTIGQQQQVVPGRGMPPSMLWNPQRGWWDYVFQNQRSMGLSAKYLPDGCAFSSHPPSIFNPITGKAEFFNNFEGNLNTDNQMVMLRDGYVVIASAQNGGAGGGLTIAKASCQGLETIMEQGPTMPAVFYQPAPSAPPHTPPLIQKPSFRQQLVERLQQIPLITWAAAGLIGILEILRRRLKATKAECANTGTTNHGWLKVPDARHPPPWRLVFWSIVTILLLLNIASLINFKLQQHWGSWFVGDTEALLDPDTGLIKNVSHLMVYDDTGPEDPSIPCNFVGVWSARNGKKIWHTTMKANGTYEIGNPLELPLQGQAKGYWMVQRGHVVWLTPGLEPDINRIKSQQAESFSLYERNSSITRFERIAALPAGNCQTLPSGLD